MFQDKSSRKNPRTSSSAHRCIGVHQYHNKKHQKELHHLTLKMRRKQWRRARGNEVVKMTMKERRKKEIKKRRRDKMRSRREGGNEAVNERGKQ